MRNLALPVACLLALLLAGCASLPIAQAVEPLPTLAAPLEGSNAAPKDLPTATLEPETAAPSPEPTLPPTVTPTPEPALAEIRLNPNKGYSLRYDPQIWDVWDLGSGASMLVHKAEQCHVVDPEFYGHGLGGDPRPQRMYLGERNWMVTYNLLYDTGPENYVRLEMSGRQDTICGQDGLAVLATLKIDGLDLGPEEPLPTFTARPFFICPQAPEIRVFIGQVAVTTTTVKLRSSPIVSDDNVLARLPQGTSFMIMDGPICGPYEGGAFAYWKVELEGEHGPISGWLAEGDRSQYFMESAGE